MAWLLAIFILLLELVVGLNRNGLKSSRIFVPKAVNCDNMPVTSSGLAKENFARIAKFVGSTVVLGGLLRSNSARATDSSDLFANVECSDSIILLEQPNTKRKVILIGTAHISDESVKLVRRVIGSTRPDTVMIELDTKRIGRATDDVNLEDLGFITPTFDDASATAVGATAEIAGSRDGGRKSIVQSTLRKVVAPIQNAVQGLAGALLGKALGQFYNSVEKLGFTAGGEFRAAVEEGRKLGAKILLGDRNVDITLQRLAAAVSAVDPTKLAAVADRLSVLEDEMGLSLTPSASTGIEKEDLSNFVESMKQKVVVNRLMAVIQQELPQVYAALVGERDAYMARAIDEVEKSQILVGVVGLAHVAGIERYLTTASASSGGGFRSVKRNCPTL